ncbi:mucoidy inhibitor MuiA family protein [Candidatus Sumerlaeota bacterium]|nr:mucoidy inhibitor MuiA family protein [Candidatus Sumerlaeota bacterium]
MKRTMRILIPMAMCVTLHLQSAAAVTTEGRVSEVTVYRDQARVTREATVEAPPGMVSVSVTGLPPHILPDSLSAETEGSNRIHAVTFRSEAVGEETRPEVLELDNQIRALEREVYAAEVEQRIANERRETAGRLDRFTAQTGQRELEHGVLKFEELRGLTDYALDLRAQAMNDELTLRLKLEDLRKEIDLLARKRRELAVGSSREKREALIHLNKSDAGPVAVKVRYLVSNVGWSPHYNVRAGENRDRLRVEYNARVRQMSGEDWSGVKLSFSTAQPSFASEPPQVKPVRVRAGVAAVPVEEESLARLSENIQLQKRTQTQALSSLVQSERLNVYANFGNAMELNTENLERFRRVVRRSRMEGVSVTYPIDQPVLLPSRSDEQLLPIAGIEVAATFQHVAAPILTDFVFESATGRNTSSVVLLPGPYVSYMNGQFVGRGEIPMVAKGEEFVAGFGVDPQVRAIRELVSREDSKSWGKKVSTFEYKIVLDNLSGRPVTLELTDRIPWSDADKVQVELLKAKPEPDRTTDARRQDFAKGLMTWDLTLPADGSGENAVTISYRYRMTGEFPAAGELDAKPVASAGPADELRQRTEAEGAQRAVQAGVQSVQVQDMPDFAQGGDGGSVVREPVRGVRTVSKQVWQLTE